MQLPISHRALAPSRARCKRGGPGAHRIDVVSEDVEVDELVLMAPHLCVAVFSVTARGLERALCEAGGEHACCERCCGEGRVTKGAPRRILTLYSREVWDPVWRLVRA